jgi:hypothetical protein
MSESQRIDYRRSYEPEVKARLTTFRHGVWGSLIFLITAVIAAVIVAAFWHTSPGSKVLLGGASIFVFAWSTPARPTCVLWHIGGTEKLTRPLIERPAAIHTGGGALGRNIDRRGLEIGVA